MNLRTPRATPAPTTAPGAVQQADVTEVLDRRHDGELTVAPLTKLGKAMEVVKDKLAVIDQFGRDVIDLIANNPKDKVYDLSTKEGEKATDAVRKLAREKRLAIDKAWKEGKAVLKNLGDDLKVAAEVDIEVLQAIEDNVKTQLEAKASKETTRKEGHEKNIKAITDLGVGLETMSTDDIQRRRLALEAIVVDDSYQEFEAPAMRKRREVADALAQAHGAAVQREQDARLEAARVADLEAQAAAAREKEERTTRIKARIQTIKELPTQVEGTGADNIREILRLHMLAVPDAEHYGDMLEFAEMAHELTAKKLQELLNEANDARWTPDELADMASRREPPLTLNRIPVGDAVQVDIIEPLDGKPIRGDDLFEDHKESTLSYRQEVVQVDAGESQQQAALRVALDKIEQNFGTDFGTDPFSKPVATTAPRAVPATRGAWRSAPPPTTVPVVDPAGPPADPQELSLEGDAPDLLDAAKRVVAAYEAAKVSGLDSPLSNVMRGEFGEAMADLKAAVDFITEFAD